MTGIIIAWLLGEGIIISRWARAGAPPTPGALALGSALFVGCALLAEYPPARTVATLLAFGVDLSAYLELTGKAPAAQQTGWPPLPVNDPTVFLPAGSNGKGQLLPEGGGGGGGGGGQQQQPITAAPGSPVNPSSSGNAPLPGFNLGPIQLPFL